MQRRTSLEHRPSRRRFLGLATAVTTLILAGCGSEREKTVQSSPLVAPPNAEQESLRATTTTMPHATNVPTQPSASATPEPGRLLARPSRIVALADVQTGRQQLGITPERDALLYVPASYSPDRSIPLVLSLHGAGGDAEGGMGLLQSLADSAHLMVLAPASRRQSWDAIHGDLGPDVAAIDRALTEVFNRYVVDSSRLAISGFSDGASYALSLGLINGDLFTHVIAFSPGFIPAGQPHGQPRLFISHGTRDDVLPIDRCSRRIVPVVQRTGYDVQYREFDGPHTVPPEIAQEAIAWFNEVTG